MNFVFIDNYRGFTETLIPIKDVNFLVGENSTGKTSVLAILKLLSPPDFWLQNEFDLKKVGLGTFKDVVSISSNDKTYFSVGIVFDRPIIRKKKQKEAVEKDEREPTETSIVALLMTFTEKEGMPRLASVVSHRNGREVRIKYIGDSIRYKSSESPTNCSAKEFGITRMKEWINIQKVDKTGYTILKQPAMFLKSAPPIVILSFLEDLIIGKSDNSERMEFEIPSFIHDIAWLAPIRSKPRKTYDEYSLDFSPEGDHTPYLIKKKLDSASDSRRFRGFIKNFGENSGLFKSIQIRNYGRGTTSPFELDVIISKDPLSVSSVGYGVSQALPVIVEIFSRPKHSWFAIQQPEVHLHPKAQAALGQIVFNLSAVESKKFIIETHSDYMIDRYRILCKKGENKSTAQVLFFERTETGNRLTSILIDNNGEFSGAQPEAYREFFIKEEMELLGL